MTSGLSAQDEEKHDVHCLGLKVLLTHLHVQVNKKLSWWDIGFEGNGGVKSKETRVCNSKGKCHSPIFSTRT